MRTHKKALLAGMVGVLVAALILASAASCGMLQQIPCVMKITVLDENGQPYGYVSISVLDEHGLVVSAGQATDRGTLIIGKTEGMRAGTYTFVVKNVSGKELPILSPDKVIVPPGRTVAVVIKLGPAPD